MSRLSELEKEAANVSVIIKTNSPGDGKTRYRFFNAHHCPDNQTYFGPNNGMYTAYGLSEAETFLTGFIQGYYAFRETEYSG